MRFRDSMKLAGYYVCFTKEDGKVSPCLRKGVLSIGNGCITSIDPFPEDADVKALCGDDIIFLDENVVMFPGLLDLHSHVEYSSFQLWETHENKIPWESRFEWRSSAEERSDLHVKNDALINRWHEPVVPAGDNRDGSDESRIEIGDILEYFAELQAAAGGTTMIQGYHKEFFSLTAESHEKIRLIRDPCLADDLDAAPGHNVKNYIDIVKPDAALTPDDPSSYLPPQETEKWKPVWCVDPESGNTHIDEILAAIKNKTSSGYLIHLAEGRAGNLRGDVDPFTRKEFIYFMDAVREGIRRGDFTAEDVRDAHIGLIHGCGIDPANEEDSRFLLGCGIGILWAPVSNLILYEDTPPYYKYLGDDDLLVAIGSDWSPGGAKTVWDECRFAYAFAKKYASPQNETLDAVLDVTEQSESSHAGASSYSAADFLKACTYTPARIIGIPKAGNIAAGGFADLFILRGKEKQSSMEAALRTFMEADDTAVEAVIVKGRTVYGEEGFIRAASGERDRVHAFSGEADFIRSSAKGNASLCYGRYDTDVPQLQSKYFLLPPAFEGFTFEEIYKKYREVIKEAQIDFSHVRALDDPVYREKMALLRERFCE